MSSDEGGLWYAVVANLLSCSKAGDAGCQKRRLNITGLLEVVLGSFKA